MQLNNSSPRAIQRYSTTSTKQAPITELRRAVLSCLLWEDQFYESGVEIGARISSLCAKVNFPDILALAHEARTEHGLRHAPLMLLCEAMKKEELKGRHNNVLDGLIHKVTSEILTRPDMMTELLAIWWKDGKKNLPRGMRKGINLALSNFSEYQLAKYDRSTAIKLRDVLRLTHPKPETEAQAALYKRVTARELITPDTWEVGLSAAKSTEEKRDVWTRLLLEKKLGGLAFLRNLRNMQEAGVREALVREYFAGANFKGILPYQFLAAARYGMRFEPELEVSMSKALEGAVLPGRTLLFVDTSGSMSANLSAKSELTRRGAAAGLAAHLSLICESLHVYTFANEVAEMPPRKGFALVSEIDRAPSGGRFGGQKSYLASLLYRQRPRCADRGLVEVWGEGVEFRAAKGARRLGSGRHRSFSGVGRGRA